MSRTILRGLLPLLLVGCASTGFLMARPKVTMFGPTYPARDSNVVVEVFQSRLPDQPYTEIARIEVGDTDDNWSMRQILAKAKEIGADAVIITGRVGNYATAVPVGNTAVAVGKGYGLSAIALRFRDR